MAPDGDLADVALAFVNTYSVLRLALQPPKSFPRHVTHYLYVQPNEPKIPTQTSARELFLVNLPIDTTAAHLRNLFNTHLGGYRIASITFDSAEAGPHPSSQNPSSRKRKRKGPVDGNALPSFPSYWDRQMQTSASSCILTFVDETSAASAMKDVRTAAKNKTRLPWGQNIPASVPRLGLARYKAHHRLRFPDAVALQENVDSYMAAFNTAEVEKAKEVARRGAEPDEDGFITVVKGGRNKSASDVVMKEQMERQKKKLAGRDDFYRFQGREKRREEAMKLRRNFEEERKRIEHMTVKVRPE